MEVIEGKKPNMFLKILSDYKDNTRLVFTNIPAVLVLIGFFCKQSQGTVQQYYLTSYFRDEYSSTGGFKQYT